MHSVSSSSNEFYSGKNKTKVNDNLLKEAGISNMPTNSNIIDNSRSSEYRQPSRSINQSSQDFYQPGNESIPSQDIYFDQYRPVSEGNREFNPIYSGQEIYNSNHTHGPDFVSDDEYQKQFLKRSSENIPDCAECDGRANCFYCGTSYRNRSCNYDSANEFPCHGQEYHQRNYTCDNCHAGRENTRLLHARRNLVKAYDEVVRAKNNENYSKRLNKGIAEICHRCGCATKYLMKKENFEVTISFRKESFLLIMSIMPAFIMIIIVSIALAAIAIYYKIVNSN